MPTTDGRPKSSDRSMARLPGQEKKQGTVKAAANELKLQNQKKEAHFKKSLGLLTGFFALILYVHHAIPRHALTMPDYCMSWASTSFSVAFF